MMHEQYRPKGDRNLGKRQELIRETIARSKQLGAGLKEYRRWEGWKSLYGKTLHFFGIGKPSGEAQMEPEEKPKPSGLMASLADPVKVKRILMRILVLLIVWELLGALVDGLENDAWGRFINDAFIAAVLFLMWGKIMTVVRRKRIEYRAKMDTTKTEMKIWDALIFSLLWSDEIYSNIPPDRRRISVISYILIAIGILVAIAHVGGHGFMPLVLSSALVLGAVNLLIWVVSLERGEKESLKTELRLAHEVQDSLMPGTAPKIPGFDIAGVSLPARDVGGDLFDYSFPNSSDSKLALAVSDVSGKGMKAAMSAVFTSGAYAAEIRLCNSPAKVLTNLNKAVFSHTKRGDFVAFLLMVLDIPCKTISMANAGQTKPLLKSGSVASGAEWIDGTGVNFALGMTEDCTYEERSIQLQSGDVLFLLTDGFTEAMNNLQESYGSERLEHFIRSFNTDRLSATQILDGLLSEVRSFTGAAPQHDDMTMIVVKVENRN